MGPGKKCTEISLFWSKLKGDFAVYSVSGRNNCHLTVPATCLARLSHHQGECVKYEA
jgi:hypothetical protein